MHTARCNCHFSCHTHPSPYHACLNSPTMHTVPRHAWPPCQTCPPAMHTPCHACPLPCIPPAMHAPPAMHTPSHTHPTTHASLPCTPCHALPLPCMPPTCPPPATDATPCGQNSSQAIVKKLPCHNFVASGNETLFFWLNQLYSIRVHASEIIYPADDFYYLLLHMTVKGADDLSGIIVQVDVVFNQTIACSDRQVYMSHFSYACKMQCPLNLVLENCKYLWFYLIFEL